MYMHDPWTFTKEGVIAGGKVAPGRGAKEKKIGTG